VTLDEAIFYALTSPGVTAIAGDRSFPVHAQQGVTMPYIVWQRISTTPLNAHDGPAELEDSLIQFSCYAATYTAAYDLRKLLRATIEHTALMNGARGIVNDLRESPEMMGATEVFRADLDVSFMCDPNDSSPIPVYVPPAPPAG